MAKVLLEGVFMSSQIREREFNGQKSSALYFDVYQADSDEAEKTVSVKSNDLTIANQLNEKYKLGSPIKAVVSIRAYKNQAYYNLVSLA